MDQIDSLSLASIIGRLHPLPSPRGAALEMLRLSHSENVSVGEIAHVAQADPVLASRLIHAANSAAHGSAPKIASVGAAVLRLGFTATRQISLGFSLVSEYRQGACRNFDYKTFWNDSLVRGLAAQSIAARLGTDDPQEALACGLLSEIGRLAFATAQTAAYGELLAQHGQRGSRLRAAERDRFGIDHGALGCALLGIWQIPSRLTASIEGYFAPSVHADGTEQQVLRMSWTLVLAELVARAAAVPDGRQDAWMHLALDAATRLDAPPDLLETVTREVVAKLPSWTRLLQLPEPEISAPDFPGYANVSATEPAERTGLHILLVEDNESDRELCRMSLEAGGHHVRVTEDGQSALESIAAMPPQLVITDIDMPGMSGLEFCRTLRATKMGASMYVIVLTGRERHEDLVESIYAGTNDFVVKSAEKKLLLARVQAAAHTVRSCENLMRSVDVARDIATELAVERGKNSRGQPHFPR